MDQNTSLVIIAAIGLVGTMFTSILGTFVAVRAANAAKDATKINTTAIDKVGVQVEEVHKTTNSKMDALAEEIQKRSFAEGKVAEKQEEAVRQAEKANTLADVALELPGEPVARSRAMIVTPEPKPTGAEGSDDV